MGYEILKYPRTPHLEGSRLQPGDEDLSQVSMKDVMGMHLVLEEKMDGANSAISFDTDGSLLLQSRGHYLTGGPREVHFNLFKQWATVHTDAFYRVLGKRYIMYGEWLYAKHSMFYDALPAYFMEFDIFDRERGVFLDTPSRRELTVQMPISPVPVLDEGKYKSIEEITRRIGRSHFVTDNHLANLVKHCEENGLDVAERLAETDNTDTMEGLYIKVEEHGEVVGRLKYVRPSFAQGTKDSPHHWLHKTIIPNQLAVPFESIFDPLPEE